MYIHEWVASGVLYGLASYFLYWLPLLLVLLSFARDVWRRRKVVDTWAKQLCTVPLTELEARFRGEQRAMRAIQCRYNGSHLWSDLGSLPALV